MKCDKLIYKRLYHKCVDGRIIEVYPSSDVDVAIYEIKELLKYARETNTELKEELSAYQRHYSELKEEIKEEIERYKRKMPLLKELLRAAQFQTTDLEKIKNSELWRM